MAASPEPAASVFSEQVIALLAPGQGSQTPGMLTPWLEVEGAAERVAAWSEATGLDLARLGTTADADEIKDTAVTQPLVVALALLAYEELRRRVELPADTVVAGHSVGELAAAAIAGVLSTDDAVALAAVRGAEMAAACALTPTGMAAVLGGDEPEVLARLEELGLVPANRNGAGQIVAAVALLKHGPYELFDQLLLRSIFSFGGVIEQGMLGVVEPEVVPLHLGSVPRPPLPWFQGWSLIGGV